VEKTTRARYDEHVRAWGPEAEEVTVRILGFLGAADLISSRYFAGEDIVYPATRENLRVNLETIANLRDTYEGSILGAPDSDDEFRDYVLALAGDEKTAQPENTRPRPGLPDATAKARVLAGQWVLMAKAEALEKLGEEREAVALATSLLRQVT
jgi:hypothetical protein